MIQLTIAMTRLPQLSRSAFQTYWYEEHAPLVKSVAGVLGILDYVQVHALDAARGTPACPYDGLAQIGFASRAAFDAVMADPAAQGAIRQLADDERRFIDLRKSPRWWSRERRII